MRKPVYVAAYHQSKFGKLMGMTLPEIVSNAALGACKEIGADASALDHGSVPTSPQTSVTERWMISGTLRLKSLPNSDW